MLLIAVSERKFDLCTMIGKNFTGKRWKAFVDVCKQQLSRGLSVQKIALSISLGFIIGISPFPGTTTVVCFILAYFLRLNYIITQSVNFAVYPLQLLLLVPYYRFGNLWFEKNPVILPELERFKFTIGNMLTILQKSAVNAVILWFLTALPVAVLLYFLSRKVLRRYSIPVSGEN